LVAAVCVRLGFWQLERLDERRSRNAAVRTATALAPLVLDADAFPRLAERPEAYAWRRARAHGQFDHAGAQVLRGRSRSGRPGVWIATPLVTPAGTVMVLRGWAPSPDGARLEPGIVAEPAGVMEVSGVLLPIADRADRGLPVPSGGGDTTWRALSRAVVAERGPPPVLPLYLQRLPDAAGPTGIPSPEPLPDLTDGSHLGYAVQWFSFAVIALAGFVVVAFRRRR
jgi:surfeit locus 1 family protein